MLLSEMQTYVRTRLGISTLDSEKTTEMTAVLSAVVAMLAATYETKQTVTTLTVTGGSATVALPADFSAVRSVYRGPTRLAPMTYDALADQLAAAGSGSSLPTDGAVGYIVESLSLLRLFPAVASQTTLTLFYAQTVPALSGASDDPQTVAGIPSAWHLLICERGIEWMAASEEETGLAADARDRADRMEAAYREYLQTRPGINDHRIPLKVYHGR